MAAGLGLFYAVLRVPLRLRDSLAAGETRRAAAGGSGLAGGRLLAPARPGGGGAGPPWRGCWCGPGRVGPSWQRPPSWASRSDTPRVSACSRGCGAAAARALAAAGRSARGGSRGAARVPRGLRAPPGSHSVTPPVTRPGVSLQPASSLSCWAAAILRAPSQPGLVARDESDGQLGQNHHESSTGKLHPLPSAGRGKCTFLAMGRNLTLKLCISALD